MATVIMAVALTVIAILAILEVVGSLHCGSQIADSCRASDDILSKYQRSCQDSCKTWYARCGGDYIARLSVRIEGS